MNIWDKDYKQGGYREWPNESMISWICSHFPLPGASIYKPVRALDLGCGAGANAWWIWEHGFETVAVDSSDAAIDAAITLRRKRNGNWAIAKRDIVFDGLYSMGDFDLICDVTCLQHLTEEDHAKALWGIYRILKPGGWVFSYRLGYGTDYRGIFPDEPPVRLLTGLELEREFVCAGFIQPEPLLAVDREYPGNKWARYIVGGSQKKGTAEPCEQASLERSSLLFW